MVLLLVCVHVRANSYYCLFACTFGPTRTTACLRARSGQLVLLLVSMYVRANSYYCLFACTFGPTRTTACLRARSGQLVLLLACVHVRANSYYSRLVRLYVRANSYYCLFPCTFGPTRTTVCLRVCSGHLVLQLVCMYVRMCSKPTRRLNVTRKKCKCRKQSFFFFFNTGKTLSPNYWSLYNLLEIHEIRPVIIFTESNKSLEYLKNFNNVFSHPRFAFCSTDFTLAYILVWCKLLLNLMVFNDV